MKTLTCLHCGNDFTPPNNKVKKYCSSTCRDRFNSRKKYYGNHEKQLSRSKKYRDSNRDECNRMSRLGVKKIYEESKSMGLSIRMVKDYGIKFLRENPDVVEILKIHQEIVDFRLTPEMKKARQAEYYQKNKDVIKEKSKKWREQNIERAKQWREDFKTKWGITYITHYRKLKKGEIDLLESE